MSTKRMEILFDDLTVEAQQEYSRTFGCDDNLDEYPIAIIEQEEE